MSDYGEPWRVQHGDESEWFLVLKNGAFPSGIADAERIVACVNACAGMDDPAAELARLQARVNELTGKLGRIDHDATTFQRVRSERNALRAQVAADAERIEGLRDERDVWDFYWNHHLNTGGARCFAIDSPLGMQWSVLTRWREDDEWMRRSGPSDRKDWPTALDAARECRRLAYLCGVWGSVDECEAARDAQYAARAGEAGGE